MAPYSQAQHGAGQLVLPQVAPPTGDKTPQMRARDSSSDTTPNNIDRWEQLRQMVRVLTGLRDRAAGARGRRRAHSYGGSSPMLLLHHDFWLEALDTKHRYGFHLRAFHDLWKEDMADDRYADDVQNRSFFYWLDHGRGRQVVLPNCDRDRLDATRVQYCSEQQRRQYEVEFTFSRLAFADGHAPVQTDGLSKWIFVLSQDDKLYVARKHKGQFHHSSFLAGEPIVAAGKIYVKNGTISAIEPHSGHFKPKLGSLTALCCVLRSHGVDSSQVHFIKPKKWKDPWPFDDAECEEFDEPEVNYISDSDYS